MRRSSFKTRCRQRAALVLVSAVALAGCWRAAPTRVEWTAMGTVAAVQYTDSRDVPLGDVARRCTALEFDIVENLLNAHDPSSEISRLAAFSEETVLARCDVRMRPCYAAAFGLMRASGGAFNPRWKGPDGLDLGAIAKGFAVDRADEAFSDFKRKDGWRMLVDLGGNVKSVKGAWRTGVLDPSGEGFAAVVDLQEGEALATSATYYRGGHIVDGRTGAVVSNGVASVTVLCKSATWADGLSTTLFVLGPDEGRRFLSEGKLPAEAPADVSALWILENGNHVTYGSHARFQGN